jgi:hypothetical protein
MLVVGLVGAGLLSLPGWVMGALAFGRQRPGAKTARPSSIPTETRWLASQREERAFRALRQEFPADQFLISAHMLLIDVIGRNRSPQLSREDRAFAWKAHCDFVIVRTQDLVVDRVVEINGPLHVRPMQAIRDTQKKRILHAFHIALDIR